MRLPLCLAIRSLSRNADDPARSGGVAALQRPIEPTTSVARTRSQFSLGALRRGAVRPEGPQVALRVARRELARAVVLIRQLALDRRPRLLRAVVERVGVVHDHVERGSPGALVEPLLPLARPRT